jgi:hypothetical protein
MTIGPEPKPIRTGATLHTVCVTDGDLSTYKLFARTYGGKKDEDIDVHNEHTATKLKMVSLYDFMLDPFKHKGHCVVMDSAYMSDAMGQVGREEWKINMVGTCQTDRCGAGPLGKAACKAKEISINTHESLLFQHKDKALTYAVWGDNNFVKTLSNYHSPVLLRGGMKRKKRNLRTRKRERDFSDVDCPTQQKTYCNTYHKIDKGNGAEAKYDLSTESHLHGWTPKLAARYFNMNMNNAYKVYRVLYKKSHGGRDPMKLGPCIKNLTHSLLQQGLEMRRRGCGAPPSATKNLDTTCSGEGRKVRSDAVTQPFESPPGAHGTGAIHTGSDRTLVSTVTARALYYQQVAFTKLKKRQPGRSHQSQAMVVNSSGRDCRYKKCLGFVKQNRERPRSFPTKYRCEECTQEKGIDFWLCNGIKNVDGKATILDCHAKYHVEKKLFILSLPPGGGSATECSVISDLTEE